jgi:hypothetical protein
MTDLLTVPSITISILDENPLLTENVYIENLKYPSFIDYSKIKYVQKESFCRVYLKAVCVFTFLSSCLGAAIGAIKNPHYTLDGALIGILSGQVLAILYTFISYKYCNQLLADNYR